MTTEKTTQIDLTTVPLFAGDIITIYDRENGVTFSLQLDKLEKDINDIREFLGTLVNCVPEGAVGKLHSKHRITLQKGIPVYGDVIKKIIPVEEGRHHHEYSGFDLEKYVVSEIHKYLSSKIPNYNAKVADVADFLIHANILSNMTHKDVRTYVLRIVRTHRKLFRSSGGWIHCLTPGVLDESPVAGPQTGPKTAVKTVNMVKVMVGIRALLESGLFGPIRITGGDE